MFDVCASCHLPQHAKIGPLPDNLHIVGALGIPTVIPLHQKLIMRIFSELKWSRNRRKHRRWKKDAGESRSAAAASESGPTETSTIVTTNVQTLKQVEPSASQPAPTFLVPSAQPAPDAAPHTLSDDSEPWTKAYDILKVRERELMEDYKKHLASIQDSGTNINLLTPRSVELIVQQLLDDREKKQWRVSLLGKEVKIRAQAEKLAKFLLWSDPLVKTALNTQPYAALAWCGVSLLLPVSIGLNVRLLQQC